MQSADKLRRKMNHERKQRIKELYRITMNEVTEKIYKDSFVRYTQLKFREKYDFIVWLVSKKLERKGYKCKLYRESYYPWNVILNVWW